MRWIKQQKNTIIISSTNCSEAHRLEKAIFVVFNQTWVGWCLVMLFLCLQDSVKQSFHLWLWISLLITVSRLPWFCYYRRVVWWCFRLCSCLWTSKPRTGGQWHSVVPTIKLLTQPLDCAWLYFYRKFTWQIWGTALEHFPSGSLHLRVIGNGRVNIRAAVPGSLSPRIVPGSV